VCCVGLKTEWRQLSWAVPVFLSCFFLPVGGKQLYSTVQQHNLSEGPDCIARNDPKILVIPFQKQRGFNLRFPVMLVIRAPPHTYHVFPINYIQLNYLEPLSVELIV
jgi:hypothetical protein